MPTREEINRVAKALADDFHPQKIILFGSRAYGNPREDSDVDLLVLLPIADSELATMTRLILAAHKVVRGTYSMDILAKDPKQAAEGYREGDQLLRDAIDRGIVLYEAAA
jgi:predicted nucleotidyltransferase